MEVQGVLNLIQKNEVIQRYLKGENHTEIAEAVGLCRQTVSKYVKQYEFSQSQLDEAQSPEEKESIIIQSQAKPTYDSSKRKRYKLTPEIEQIIEDCLADNEIKRQSGNRKVIMKKIDIHEHLLDKGYDLSYRSVCQFISNIEKKAKEAFIKQDYNPGECVEFDWGEVTLFIDELGGEIRIKIGVFTLKNSDHRWASLYLNENTESFLDIHIKYFSQIGGVPNEVVYDNALVNVIRLAGKEKKPTPAVRQLSSYYGYNPRYTNYYSGNEKGNVERAVEIVRRKAFCVSQRFNTLADAELALNEALNKMNAKPKQRTGKSAEAAFAEEKDFLLADRIPMDASQTIVSNVNKYSFIYVDCNFYSVPDYLVGKKVMVKKYPLHLQIYYNDKLLFKTNRITGKNQYQIDICHYLRTLKKKPGAIAHSLALKQAVPWLQEIFHLYYSTSAREYIGLLELIEEFTISRVQVAVKQLELNNLPVENSYIKNELLRRKIPVPIPLKDENTIKEKCENHLAEISLLHRQGELLCAN